MTKNAKRIFMLVGGGVVALLIVLALFGNTYARYTSAGEGDAAVSVALWDLETTSCSGTVEGSVSAISPSMDDYYDASAPRTNYSEWVELFEVTNYSDVAARVELTTEPGDGGDETPTTYQRIAWDEWGVATRWSEGFVWGTGFDTDTTGDRYGRHIMKMIDDEDNLWFDLVDAYGFRIFTAELGYKVKDTEDDPIKAEGDVIELPAAVDGAATTYTVCARVVWTSPYSNNESDLPGTGGSDEDGYYWVSWKEYSDAVDTLFCMYLDSVSFDVVWTAYQASTLPA